MKKYNTTILTTHTTTPINYHFIVLETLLEGASAFVAVIGIITDLLKYDNGFNVGHAV